MRTSSKLLILFLLLATLLSSCIGASGFQMPAAISQSGIGSEPVYVTVPPDATPTPTPFQPLPPTAVYVPNEEGAPTSTPLPPVELNTDSIFKYGESEPQPILSQPYLLQHQSVTSGRPRNIRTLPYRAASRSMKRRNSLSGSSARSCWLLH